MKKNLLFVLVVVGLVFGTASLSSATIIDTTTNGYDSVQIINFGNSLYTDHYGQTFNIGSDTDTQLDSVSFALNQISAANVTFNLNIYEWTGSSVSGPALFTSSPLGTTTQNSWETFLIDDIGLSLSNNTNYLFELDAFNTLGGYAQVAATPNKLDLYSPGMFVYSNYQDQYSNWTTGYWGSGDLAFVMETSSAAAPVPEPTTILLMGAGLFGLAGYNRKRFNKQS